MTKIADQLDSKTRKKLEALKGTLHEEKKNYRLKLENPVNGRAIFTFATESDLFDFVTELELSKEKFSLSWYKLVGGYVWREIERWKGGTLTRGRRR